MNIKHEPQFMRGTSVFLAAGTGSEEGDSGINVEQVQEGVVSLARAIFSRGGSVTLAGNAPLLTLVLTVAAEYWHPPLEETADESRFPFVQLFGSTLNEGVEWWRNIGILSWEPTSSSLQNTISLLIERTQPLGMICIGGDGEVFEQAAVVREHPRKIPLVVIRSPGGDAAIIHQKFKVSAEDETFMEKIRELRRKIRPSNQDEEALFAEESRVEMIPFPLMIQRLVDRLTQ